MDGKPDLPLRRIRELVLRQEHREETKATTRSRLRSLAQQLYLLLLLTSPIWVSLLVIKFAPPDTTVALALCMGAGAATGAFAILTFVRRLNHQDARQPANRPPDC